MADIFDYLRWRGDVPLDSDKFNEVDNLILSELAYTNFDSLIPEDGSLISLEEVRDRFFTIHSRIDILNDTSPTAKSPLLMDAMLSGARFDSLKLSDYVNVVDQDKSAQFSAVTFHLADGTSYVAYRGTDSTIVGWKEDFNMSYQPVTEGQRLAAAYLDGLNGRLEGPVRVGGHSKGGNFAVFAAAFAKSSIRDRITEVYSNDGPGFRQEIMDTPEYAGILPKVISIVPDTSIIGMLLTSHSSHRIVRSSETGIMQHDGFTWQVERNRFIQAEMSELGKFIMQAQRGWLMGIDDERRESFVNSLFSLFEATGMDTFGEIGDQKLRSIEHIMTAIQDMPADKKRELVKIIGKLIQKSGETAIASVTEALNK